MILNLLEKSIPEYKTYLPDEKEQLSYRPMLVKEEKFLSVITNIKSEFPEKIVNLCSLVDSCFNQKVQSLNMTICDFQVALNKIRQKSISEEVSFKMTCPVTKEIVHVHLNLDSFFTEETESVLELKINDKFMFKFEKPKVKSLLNLTDFPASYDDWFTLIVDSLVEIQSETEKIDATEISLEEKSKYIDLLNKKDFKKIEKFVKSNCINFKLEYRTTDQTEREIEVDDFVNFLKFFLVILTL